ncbi:BQ2448_2267 [Microbotryum intermedium]|uniref:BQ2448_2267 protein n=1 Tax=Microbotryum intermedium TaxID=269621 RepID=A0A238F7X3_9BASI|nr:BQ2448_2267 [Microbotryum intermedium]
MTIMIALVALAILVSFSNCIWTAAYVFIYKNYTERYRLVTPVTVWLTISAGCDVTIAGILLFKLNQARKVVAHRAHSTLRVPLQKLIIMALESGSVTSFVAIVGLGLYLGFKTTNLPLAPGYCLGRIYALTMLFNLRVGDQLQAEAISSQGVGVSTFALRADAHTELSKDPHEFDAERQGVMSSVSGVSTIKPIPRRGQTSTSQTVQTVQTVQTISLETAYIMHCPTTSRIRGLGIGEESDGFDADSSSVEEREPRPRRPRRAARRESASSRRSSVSIPSVDDPMLATLHYVPRQGVSPHDLL